MPRFLSNLLGPRPAPARAGAVAPMYNVASAADGQSAELTLFGDVLERAHTDWWTGETDDYCISVQQVVDDLAALGQVRELHVRLNSSGGDVFAGIAIYNAIKGLNANVTVTVEGLAASAASVIMCAGDTIRVHAGSMVMVHNVSACIFGYFTIADLQGVINDISAPERSLRTIYANRTGGTEEEMQALMDATTWYVGQEAVDAGFADEVIGVDGPDPADDEDPVETALDARGGYLMVAGVRHPLDRLPNLPEWLASGQKGPIAGPPARTYRASAGAAGKTEKEEELEISNLGELRAAYPGLVAEAEARAAAAERSRIQEIEEIQNQVGNAALVARAKFGDEPMSAGTLAVEAMKAGRAAGAKFLAEADEDQDDSNADDVDSKPADEESGEGSDEEEVKNAVALFKAIKKGVVR